MKSKSKMTLIVSFLTILLFSATICGQSKSLIGEWTLLSLTENGNDIPLVNGYPTVDEVVAQLRLTKDSFNVKPACNIKSGKYTIMKSFRLKLTSLRTTVMGCSSESHEFDSRFMTVFSKATKYKIKNKVLTLQDVSGQNVLVFNYSSSRN